MIIDIALGIVLAVIILVAIFLYGGVIVRHIREEIIPTVGVLLVALVIIFIILTIVTSQD